MCYPVQCDNVYVFHTKEAKKFIKYTITNGENTWLWHDPWCIEGLLIDIQMTRVQLQQLPLESKVSSLITTGEWYAIVHSLPDGRVKQMIIDTEIDSCLVEDKVVWTPNTTGRFSTKTAYNALSLPKIK
ncbi:hypothetical protein IFM89_019132 [Coptis chinensis]|uniref:Uncharacterized protein n=1 Tax=Coptis chinensis TaxID=261450 RepID=A0A835LHR1_9MAGN|nr:hypothetical protein IFM89_019132 [Coptis chinensis]